MYVISNQEMEQLIENTRLMLKGIKGQGLRDLNRKRVAIMLIRKLRAKRPFNLNDIPNDIRRLITKSRR